MPTIPPKSPEEIQNEALLAGVLAAEEMRKMKYAKYLVAKREAVNNSTPDTNDLQKLVNRRVGEQLKEHIAKRPSLQPRMILRVPASPSVSTTRIVHTVSSQPSRTDASNPSPLNRVTPEGQKVSQGRVPAQPQPQRVPQQQQSQQSPASGVASALAKKSVGKGIAWAMGTTAASGGTFWGIDYFIS